MVATSNARTRGSTTAYISSQSPLTSPSQQSESAHSSPPVDLPTSQGRHPQMCIPYPIHSRAREDLLLYRIQGCPGCRYFENEVYTDRRLLRSRETKKMRLAGRRGILRRAACWSSAGLPVYRCDGGRAPCRRRWCWRAASFYAYTEAVGIWMDTHSEHHWDKGSTASIQYTALTGPYTVRHGRERSGRASVPLGSFTISQL